MREASSADRIRAHTPAAVNERIDSTTVGAFERCRRSRDPAAIVERMHALDREWDIDRAVMAFFSVAGATVHELSLRHHPGWSRLLRVQLGFLFWHAAVGWCPPASLLRRLGFRSRHEIDREQTALRALLAQRRAYLQQQAWAQRQAQVGAQPAQRTPPQRTREQPRSSAEARIEGYRPAAVQQALAEQRARPHPRPVQQQQRPQIIPPARPALPPSE
jgi:hypothetical protein